MSAAGTIRRAPVADACDDCLRRTALIAAIAGRLQIEFKRRDAPARVLALPDAELLAIGASGDVRRAYAAFHAAAARARAARSGLSTVCRCRERYPARLRDLADPPAVLHILGDPGVLGAEERVAIVGARRASPYGVDLARALGRGLSVAGVPVVSGLALGIDSAAHAGALDGPARTIGVLAGSADVAYPASGRRLHAAVAARGAVVSELPPGASAHKWCFVARNRVIAALAAITVVVQATQRSGSLTTADFANELGRTVAAVPGPVTSALSAGVHQLIQAGAPLVGEAADVLELLAACTGRTYATPAAPHRAPALDDALAGLLAEIEAGRGTLSELATSTAEAHRTLAGLGALERLGLVRRGLSGRWERAAT